MYEEYWAVHGKIAKYEHARRRGVEAILERQPCGSSRSCATSCRSTGRRTGSRSSTSSAGPTATSPRPLRARRDRRGARAVPGRARRCSWPASRACRAAAWPCCSSASSSSTCCSTWRPTATRATGCRLCRCSSCSAAHGSRAGAADRGGARTARRAVAAALAAVVLALSVGPSLVAWANGRGRRPGSRAGPEPGRARGPGAGGADEALRAIPLALLLAVVVRVPFWIEALRTPVDGDTAIVGLMATHPGVGTTMWGQPYGSPVDSWVALPFVAAGATRPRRCACPSSCSGSGSCPSPTGSARSCTTRPRCPRRCSWPVRRPYFLLLAALPPPLLREEPAAVRSRAVVLGAAGGARRRGGPPPAAGHAAPGRAVLRPRAVDAPDVGERRRRRGRVGAGASRGRRRLLLWALVPLRRGQRAVLDARCCATPRRRASSQVGSRNESRLSTSATCCRGCTSRSAESSAPTCR